MLRNNIGTSFPAKVIIIFYEASNNKVRMTKVPSKVTIYIYIISYYCMFICEVFKSTEIFSNKPAGVLNE